MKRFACWGMAIDSPGTSASGQRCSCRVLPARGWPGAAALIETGSLRLGADRRRTGRVRTALPFDLGPLRASDIDRARVAAHTVTATGCRGTDHIGSRPTCEAIARVVRMSPTCTTGSAARPCREGGAEAQEREQQRRRHDAQRERARGRGCSPGPRTRFGEAVPDLAEPRVPAGPDQGGAVAEPDAVTRGLHGGGRGACRRRCVRARRGARPRRRTPSW